MDSNLTNRWITTPAGVALLTLATTACLSPGQTAAARQGRSQTQDESRSTRAWQAPATVNRKAKRLSKKIAWRIDRRNSYIHFRQPARVVTVEGSFRKFRLHRFVFTSGKATSLRGSILIETASVHTKNQKRDAHLRADDFFWSKKYPHAVIRVIDLEEDDGEYEVTFLLQIRNKTRRYVIPLELSVKGKTITASGRFRVRRGHFDLVGNYAQNKILKKDALVRFKLRLVRR